MLDDYLFRIQFDFELFGNEHGNAGVDALPHLGAWHRNAHGVVWLDLDPGIKFRCAIVALTAREAFRVDHGDVADTDCKPCTDDRAGRKQDPSCDAHGFTSPEGA